MPSFLDVIAHAEPLQIRRNVVSGVAVNVIDNRTFGGVRVRAEGFRHQSADKKMPAFTVSAKTDTLITFVVHERRQKPRLGPL